MRLLPLAIMLCFAVPVAADQTWTTIAEKDRRYSIEFPGKPDKEGSMHSLPALEGKAAYIVNSQPVVVNLNDKADVQSALDRLEELGIEPLPGAKVLRKNDTTIQSRMFPRRQVDIDVSAATGFPCIYKMTIVLDGQNYYSIAVMGPPDFVDAADAKRFTDSFKVLE